MTSLTSTDQPPRISVIMAVYNAERYLAEAVESVLAQTYADFEFLIHDDGSTDGSPEILRRIAGKDPRIDVSFGENAGPAAARNILLARARGVFIAVMDADDVCRPDRFKRQVTYLDAHPDIAVLGSHIRYIDEAGRPVRELDYPADHAQIDARNYAGNTAIVHPTVMMRREAVQAVGGYDESFSDAQDLELWLRMAERFRLANMPEVLLDYRFHPFSISASADGSSTNNERARILAARRRGLPEDKLKPRDLWNWRPAPDRRSQSDFAVTWAWQSRKAGYSDTARHYFLKALRVDPLSRRAWHGLIFGVLRDNKPADPNTKPSPR